MQADEIFNDKEITRYQRQLGMALFGVQGQHRLKAARVVVIGAGGLGCPVLQYLSAAGVGTIGIVDADIVDLSNLHRQVIFTEKQCGQKKTDAAVAILSANNPDTRFEKHSVDLTSANAIEIIGGYDVVMDCTDNFSTRYLINDACVLLDKPWVYGSVYEFEGQVTVFNYKEGPTYRCLFPTPPAPGSVKDCAETGVLGIMPGIIGTFQASEAIKLITGIGEITSGRLMIFNLLRNDFQSLFFGRNPETLKSMPNSFSELKGFDYGLFCGIKNPLSSIEIEPARLSAWLKSERENLQLVDVRELNEGNAPAALHGMQIPFTGFQESINNIDPQKKVILFCRSGIRSLLASRMLAEQGYQNVYCLRGGITAWNKETSQ
jgi:molybdopterin/thiamine biosynthesis adenylyltransferase/rhodanese-related sulfurtransferase